MTTRPRGVGRSGVAPPTATQFRKGYDPRRRQASSTQTAHAIVGNYFHGFARRQAKTDELLAILNDGSRPHAERVAARFWLLLLGVPRGGGLAFSHNEKRYFERARQRLRQAALNAQNP